MPLSKRPAVLFRHVQAAPAVTWTINHGQGSYPLIDAYVTSGGVEQKVMPMSVSYVNANQATLTFSAAIAGHATAII